MGKNARVEGEASLLGREGDHDRSSCPVHSGLLNECLQTTSEFV